jgi:hypothetical protein
VYFKGDAPTPGTLMPGPVAVFSYDDPTAVYYLPGTSGWGSTYAGQPAVLWNPQMQGVSFNWGSNQGRFGFTIKGTADIPVVIEAATNPFAAAWTPLETCTLTNGAIDFSESSSATYPGRFYRIRSP